LSNRIRSIHSSPNPAGKPGGPRPPCRTHKAKHCRSVSVGIPGQTVTLFYL